MGLLEIVRILEIVIPSIEEAMKGLDMAEHSDTLSKIEEAILKLKDITTKK